MHRGLPRARRGGHRPATSPRGGELALALRAGFDPERIHLHGNAKSRGRAARGARGRRRPRRLDNARRASTAWRRSCPTGAASACCCASRPACPRHARLDLHRPGRLEVRLRARRRAGADRAHRRPPTASTSRACTCTSARRSSTLAPFRARDRGDRAARRLPRSTTSAAGSASPTRADSSRRRSRTTSRPRSTPCTSSSARTCASLDEPGRALVANSTRDALHRRVDQAQRRRPTSPSTAACRDNLRPMLYGARYEAAGRRPLRRRHALPPRRQALRVGRRDRPRRRARRPAAGRRLVTPGTGAYGYAMANNYNGVPRPPVIFCPDGDARVVVRRETYDDLPARDVDERRDGFRVGLLGPRHRRRGVRRAAARARRRGRGDHRPAARAHRRAHPLARRLRGDPRRLGPDRRGHRRHRARARLRPARDGRRASTS